MPGFVARAVRRLDRLGIHDAGWPDVARAFAAAAPLWAATLAAAK